MVSPELPILIPEPVEYVTLYGKKDFIDVIKLQILRWGDYPGLSAWAPYNYKGPYKTEVAELVRKVMGQESGVGRMGFKDGGASKSWTRQGNKSFPCLHKACSPANTLTLALLTSRLVR